MLGHKEIDKTTERDILQCPHLRENPYNVPDGYFASVEDAVHKKIYRTSENANPLLSFLKTSVALVCVFGMVFGFGYGAMYLSGTLDTTTETHEYTAADIETPIDDLMIKAIGISAIVDTPEEIDGYPNMSDTLTIDKEQIEQYLIESNISIAALASLE